MKYRKKPVVIEAKSMKVYLSGSITSDPNYKEHFTAAREYFTNLGYGVVDPTQFTAESYEEYLRIDLLELLECNYICYVNDVTTSKGALVEKIVSDAVGIKETKCGKY